jgi:1-acyl-sn-glycerol-3-phosphate acyltransferase
VPFARRLAATAAAVAFAAYGWLLVGLVAVPAAALVVVLPRPSWRWRAARRGAGALAHLSGTKLTASGLENVPRTGGAVIIANHPSYLDGFALVAVLPVPPVFVAGEVFANQRAAGVVLRRLGAEFVERSERREAVLGTRRLIGAARSRRQLVVVPEGGLSRAPGLRPFHLGAFVTAAGAGVPVVPVAITGSRSMLRPGHKFVRRGAIHLQFGAPLVPAGEGWPAATELHRTCRAWMLGRSGEPDQG